MRAAGLEISDKINAGLVPFQCMCLFFFPKLTKPMRADNEKHRKNTLRPYIVYMLKLKNKELRRINKKFMLKHRYPDKDRKAVVH